MLRSPPASGADRAPNGRRATWVHATLVLQLTVSSIASFPIARVAAQENNPALRFVTAEAISAVIAYPKETLELPAFELAPKEIISAVGQRDFGLDPLEIEWVVAFAEAPGPAAPPGYGIVVRLAKPFDRQKLLPAIVQFTEPSTIQGREFLKATQPMLPSLMLPNDRTVVIAPEATLAKMLSGKTVSSPLLERLTNLKKHSISMIGVIDPIRPMLEALMAQANVPPPLEQFKKLPTLLSAVEAHVDIAGESQVQLTLHAINGDAGEQIESMLNDAIALAKQIIMAQVARSAASRDPVEQAAGKYAERVTDRVVTMLKPKRQAEQVQLAVQGELNTATLGISIGLMLPAVQSAREAARRTAAVNNLKQIGLAMHNFHDAYGKLPARAIMSKDGKPLLSWRVAILPFVEQVELYQQFHLDEPWDSEHNKKLIERMPAVYRAPGAAAEVTKTNYLVPAGPGTLFEKVDKGTPLRSVVDGTSNTIMAVEVSNAKAVIWTKPDDWEYDPEKPMDGLVGLRPGIFQALLADGAVRIISENVDQKILRALFSMAGGEVIPQY